MVAEQYLREKFNPDGSQLRKAQLRMLELLRFIDKICVENDIDYWLDSGTLLGAERHGGFIPWDDDADICMPKDQLEKFKKVFFEKYADSSYALQCDETDSKALCPWVVLRDLKSEYIQDSDLHRRRRYRGLQVDIFPVEYNLSPMLHSLAAYLMKGMVFAPYDRNSMRWFRPFADISFRFLRKIVYPFFHLLSPFKKKYAMISYGVPFGQVMKLSDLYPLGHIQFEGVTLKAPKDVDAYLTEIYGDWRKIPSLDSIQTHNVDIRFF